MAEAEENLSSKSTTRYLTGSFHVIFCKLIFKLKNFLSVQQHWSYWVWPIASKRSDAIMLIQLHKLCGVDKNTGKCKQY